MAAHGERDDAALVAAALGGDNSAFSELMTRHRAALYRFVRRYVGDDDEALDLVQDAFVSCWSALDSFKPARRPFDVWLRRIALNKCRDWSRRRKVRQFFFNAAPLDQSLAVSAPLQEPPDQRLAKLDAAIAQLPAALKEPLLLVAFENMSHVEAASMLGVSAKAIETRLYRAKQKLRETITPSAELE
jgi:RNA polymerase sigma-70 factor (ECF subfamily)